MATAYRVVPFVAQISSDQGSQQASSQLEKLVTEWAAHGWEYIRLENVETYVAGRDGCFGFGATPARMTSYAMVVFRKCE